MRVQRVKAVQACTEAAGVRNSTSLQNIPPPLESSVLFLLDQGIGFMKLLRVATALCKQDHRGRFLKIKSEEIEENN